jgi:SWI/SNF-related matrix-associated actin-dependent regulator of chromatin subfamily A-like protein 1
MILARLAPRPLGFTAVYTPFDHAVVAQFKTMPGCEWDPVDRAWVGPSEAVDIVLERLIKAGVLLVAADQARPQLDEPHSFNASGLYRHQVEGVSFILQGLEKYSAVLIGDEPGTGKSAQTLRALQPLALPADHILILCPAVVAPHWAEEAERWAGWKAARLDGPKSKTKAGKALIDLWIKGGGVGVCSYDTFRGLAESLPPVRFLVLDELHYLANAKAIRSKAVRGFAERARPQLIGLTGTPMTARPRDLHHPLDLLFPQRFGKFFKFGLRYCAGHQSEIKGVERAVWDFGGASNLDELGRRMRDGQLMLRRVKSEVLELPARQRIMMPIELPTAARKALARVSVSEGQEVGKALAAVEEHKLAAAVELAQGLLEQGRKILLFTLRRDTAHRIAEELNCPCVTGEDEASERRTILADAVCGVATVYSVTTGINLTQFDTAIFVGLDWVPSTLLQAEARLHRIGQAGSTTFYYLIGLQTIDEVIRMKVIERLGAFEQVVGNAPDEKELAGTLSGSETEEELLASIVADVMGVAA